MAMTNDWITLPGPPIREEQGEPYLVRESERGRLLEHLSAAGAGVVEVDLGDADNAVDVLGALKEVLEFPSWCGSGWDSIFDAFSELREAWSFPLAIVVLGLPKLLVKQPHLALNTVLGLSRFCEEFSIAGDQLVVFYLSEPRGN